MSKHIFKTTKHNQRHEIQIGWDKPMQTYYGSICQWVKDPSGNEDGYFDDLIWSSIFAPKHEWELEDIETAIQEQGFTIPEGLLENVKNDRRRNAVNEIRFYDQPIASNNTIKIDLACNL